MNKLVIIALTLVALTQTAWASGIESVSSTGQHQVTVEGPNVIGPDADKALVAAVNKRFEMQLQQTQKALEAKINSQLERSLR